MRGAKYSKWLWLVVITVAITSSAATIAQTPLGTEVTYQGQLKEGGSPANGNDYDFRFRLFDALNGGSQVGTNVFLTNVQVSGGLFTAELDFGSGVFTGDALWLEVGVKRLPLDPYTILSPRQPLTAAPYALYALDGPGGPGFWAASGNDIYNTNSGKVGIGTTEPTGSLHVTNNGEAHAIWAETTDIAVLAYRTASSGSWPAIHGDCASASNGSSGVRGYITNDNPGALAAGVYGVCTSIEPDASDAVGVRGRHAGSGTGVYGESIDGTGVRGDVVDAAGYAGYFTGGRNYFEGYVGIGTTPDAHLDVVKNSSSTADHVLELKTYSTPPFWWALNFSGSSINSDGFAFMGAVGLSLNNTSGGDVTLAGGGGDVLLANGGGNVGIGTSSPLAKLDVHGNVMIHSATSGALLIELGEGLDYAEGFDVSDKSQIIPGMVLVIDADNPGKLVLSTTPYDRKVAGIVAGANGLGSAVRLGADQFDLDVALAGRVYCWVDATAIGIEPGDLLTTSGTPGHAMKVSNHAKAQGAILGKAMERLEKGEQGQILVLVTLQ